MNTVKINKHDSTLNKEYKPVSELSAAIQGKCPRCRKGDIFANKMYGFSTQKMNETCPCCRLRFEKEPGYWYVSMFVSYALNVAELVILAVATYIFSGNLENPYLYMGVLFAGILTLSPINFRYSRVILLYWLTPGLRYNPDVNKE